MQYILVHIGCIECCVPSDIVGVFSSKENAEKIMKDCSMRFGDGSNEFKIFEMPMLDTINKDYI